LLARQAMPDMLLVAPMMGAMGLALAAMHASPSTRTRAHHVLGFELHAGHVIAACVLFGVLAQAMWLVTRNCTFSHAGFEWHLDRYFSGSTGNCDLGGQPACAKERVLHPALQPSLQAAMWIALGVPSAIHCAT